MRPCAGAASWAGLATVATTPTAVVALLLLGSASTACADVVADSVVVQLVQRPGSKAVRACVLRCGAAHQRSGRAGMCGMPCGKPRSVWCCWVALNPSLRPSLSCLPGLQGTAGSLQSLCWASASAGGIASAYFRQASKR